MTRIEVLKACNNIESCIMVSVLSNSVKQELIEAVISLRQTSLQAISSPEPKTATQLCDEAGRVEIIAEGDSLHVFAAVMPYLLHRRDIARAYMDKPDDRMVAYLADINKNIAEILSIF